MHRRGLILLVAALAFGALAALATACGTTAPATPDAGAGSDASMPPDAGADATTGACAELAMPDEQVTALPGHVSGNVSTGGADLMAPNGCATVDAPYGVQSAGPDDVIEVSGLTAGTDYVVRVDGVADLSFYVITGCAAAAGPTSQQCLLYEDATTSGTEVGHFVAPADHVWIVVDYYASQPPPDGSWTADVYASQCTGDQQCSGATPSCLDGRCVGCSSSFDCTDAKRPVCDTNTHVCGPGAGGCTGDDPSPPENGDDGPAGARPLVPDGTGRASATGHICDVPSTERDFYAFTVTQPGDDWELQLGWNSNEDLDLAVYDAQGRVLGLSYYEQPEDIVLTYLPAGTYYVAVSEYTQAPETAATPYTLRTQRVPDACTGDPDCAQVYRNQIYRGDCQAGACRHLGAAGTVAAGGACDAVSDCAAGTSCASFYFTSGADTRDVCGTYCNRDSDCAGMGPGFVCTNYLAQNFCVEACTADSQCPVSVNTAPQIGPWARLHCDRTSGHCLP